MTIAMSFRVDTLDRLIAENLLIRNAWTGRAPDGRDTACLLAALSPEVGAESRPSACPADVMPVWFAELTPWLDDKGSTEAWPGMVRRYATLARRWHVLTPDDWHRLDYTVRALSVREAMRHTTDPKALAVCEDVAVLCEREARGDSPGAEAFAEAAEAAEAAWAVAARAAAARAVAARAVAAAAWAAVAAWAAAWAAEAEAEAAADRLTVAILDALEAAIVVREAA